MLAKWDWGITSSLHRDQLEERKIEGNFRGRLGHEVREAQKTETGLEVKIGLKSGLLKENCSLSSTHHHHGFLLTQPFLIPHLLHSQQ